jgi:CspA family cold shock protein
MPERLRVIVCQRCGRGFVLTATHRNWLSRRGSEVVQPVLCPSCYLKAGPLPKRRGTVKWFSPRKHYGFIETRDGDEVFFHQRQILRGGEETRLKGQLVRFHVRNAPKGPEALNVELEEG